MDEIDRRIVNGLQRGFPLCHAPFEQAAAALGLGESELIERIEHMLERGILTRFGPLLQIERMGGVFALAAMQVPAADFDAVAARVNARPEVAHNYEREHALNMWFVIAAESQQAVDAALRAIENDTGLPVFAFPKEREYFVGMELTV
jgi:DNA-binding Lrp family transcriptional regulator